MEETHFTPVCPCTLIFNEVTISPEKIILQKEKEHCAIFIHAHFMCLWLGLG